MSGSGHCRAEREELPADLLEFMLGSDGWRQLRPYRKSKQRVDEMDRFEIWFSDGETTVEDALVYVCTGVRSSSVVDVFSWRRSSSVKYARLWLSTLVFS